MTIFCFKKKKYVFNLFILAQRWKNSKIIALCILHYFSQVHIFIVWLLTKDALLLFFLFILLYNIVLVLPYIDLNVFPILNPPPTSLPIPSLWFISVLFLQFKYLIHENKNMNCDWKVLLLRYVLWKKYFM